MPIIEDFDQVLTKPERQMVARLTTPNKIQIFLDGLPYSTEAIYRCPLRVLRERIAHCFDGALFAAASLRRIGYPPLILELIPTIGMTITWWPFTDGIGTGSCGQIECRWIAISRARLSYRT